MKKWLLLVAVLLCLLIRLPGQVELSGILNRYAKVEAIDFCTAQIQVDDAAWLQPGMDVLLIQMQGAAIQGDDTPGFGAITDPGAAGRYEIVTIEAINGTTVDLAYALLHDYDAAGSVQLVSIPRYADATVTAPLTAQPWDGATGGVLLLQVDGTLTLRPGVNIDVSGQGFRGGPSEVIEDTECGFGRNENDWYYNRAAWEGAPKGEGIANYLLDKENGRGAQANGGGGGNDHNTGGGGGANGGGGGGGGVYEVGGLFGCNGDYPGQGGRAVPAGEARLFLGGGGGAGHENNMVGTDGGNGGGLVLLLAGAVALTGDAQILADGIGAGTSRGDGAGGGGAGGTVFLQAGQVNGAGALQVIARGGDGGTADNRTDNRCYGPGGGGSGGSVLTNQAASLTADLGGGDAGRTINSPRGCNNTTNGAASGESGRLTETDLPELPRSLTPIVPLAITDQPGEDPQLCVGESTALRATAEGVAPAYQWQVDRGSGFTDLPEGGAYAGTTTPELTIEAAAGMDGERYRLRVSNDCFGELFTEPVTLGVSAAPVAGFVVDQEGATIRLTDESLDAERIRWDFGDGAVSTDTNPSHTYTASGTYTVLQIAETPCANDTARAQIRIELGPGAAFTATPLIGCAPLTVTFQNQSQGDGLSAAWRFPGGEPATAAGDAPIVRYAAAGSYDVELIVSNADGADTLFLPGYINVTAAPVAAFETGTEGRTVTLTNNSQNATAFFWDFGDGNTSTATAPSHTYAADGAYTITLRIEDEICGVVETSATVTIASPPVAGIGADATMGCRPLTVQFQNQASDNSNFFRWSFPGGTPATSEAPNPSVTYGEAGSYDVQLIVGNEVGSDTLLLNDYIKVEEGPSADFSAEVDELDVRFTFTGSGAVAFQWNFGDGNSSQGPTPQHRYPAPGRYEVLLTVSNNCGIDTATQLVTVGQPPRAAFTLDRGNGCIPHTIQFTDESTGTFDTYQWSFPGGTPASSTEADPVVTYSQPGDYDVTLTVVGILGESRAVQSRVVKVRTFPEATFEIESIDGATVAFRNLSAGADSYQWDFGDGAFSTDENPVHTYDSSGVYEVTLNAQNGTCASAVNQTIAILLTNTPLPVLPAGLQLFPNPTAGALQLRSDDPGLWPLDIRVFGADGRAIRHTTLPGNGTLDLSDLPAGVYWLHLKGEKGAWITRVVRMEK